MKKYCVQLIEAEFALESVLGEDYWILFECEAENFDHAIDQAFDAYPDAELLECVEEGE